MDKILICTAIVMMSCTQIDPDVTPTITTNNNSNSSNDEWLVPISEVFDGGPGKDGIPSIDNPNFTDINNVAYLEDNDLVLIVKSNQETKIYPHKILDWHEIVNDKVGDKYVAITYCPLTGTGIGWDRQDEDDITTYGVSGLLYNSNLMPYDRSTESTWSQIRNDCVNGSLIGEKASLVSIIETTWETAKVIISNAVVLNLETGYTRPYGTYPYGEYKTADYLIFPVSNHDSRISKKERVYALLENDTVTAFRMKDFTGGIAVHESFTNQSRYVIVGSSQLGFITAFKNPDPSYTFYSVQDAGDIVLEDNFGTRWNVFGEAVEGPGTGDKLEPATAYMAYWFSLAAFFPEIEIYNN